METNCSRCNAPFPTLQAGICGGAGYATLPNGRKICYPCADAIARDEIKPHDKQFYGYVSSDGKSITTWSGGKLGTVIASRPCKLTRQSFTHSPKSYRSIRMRDESGNDWSGRGSPGIVIKMRPVK